MTIRVVFDTNILISSILSLRGSPFRCVAMARTGLVQSVTCAQILDEFAEKLRVKFAFAATQCYFDSVNFRAGH